MKTACKPVFLRLLRRHVLLEELDVGVELDLDEVWRLDAFLDVSEVDTFRHKLLVPISEIVNEPAAPDGSRDGV